MAPDAVNWLVWMNSLIAQEVPGRAYLGQIAKEVNRIEKCISIYQFALGNCTLKEYREYSGRGVKESRRKKRQILQDIKECSESAKEVAEQIKREGNKEEKALLRLVLILCKKAEQADHCFEWFPPERCLMGFLMNNVSFCDFVFGITGGKVRAVLDGLDGMYLFGQS